MTRAVSNPATRTLQFVERARSLDPHTESNNALATVFGVADRTWMVLGQLAHVQANCVQAQLAIRSMGPSNAAQILEALSEVDEVLTRAPSGLGKSIGWVLEPLTKRTVVTLRNAGEILSAAGLDDPHADEAELVRLQQLLGMLIGELSEDNELTAREKQIVVRVLMGLLERLQSNFLSDVEVLEDARDILRQAMRRSPQTWKRVVRGKSAQTLWALAVGLDLVLNAGANVKTLTEGTPSEETVVVWRECGGDGTLNGELGQLKPRTPESGHADE